MASKTDTMLAALACVARTARRDAAVRRHEIAVDAGVYPSTIDRFEQAKAWPRNPEALITAYANRAGMRPKELWLAAAKALCDERC